MAAQRRGRAFDSSPRANTAAPANDGVQDTSVVLDFRLIEDHSFFDAHACTDNGFRADRHVGTEFCCRVDLGGWMDEDGRHDGRGRLGDLLGLLLECLLQVQRVRGHGTPRRLDLAPEVLGFVDEEAVAVGEFRQDVLLQAHDFIALAVFVIIGNEAGLEVLGRWVADQAGPFGLALDGGLDGGKDGVRGEQIDAAVDHVGDMAFGFLDVVEHAFRVGVGDDAAEIRGRVVADSRSEDDGFGVLLLE